MAEIYTMNEDLYFSIGCQAKHADHGTPNCVSICVESDGDAVLALDKWGYTRHHDLPDCAISTARRLASLIRSGQARIVADSVLMMDWTHAEK